MQTTAQVTPTTAPQQPAQPSELVGNEWLPECLHPHARGGWPQSHQDIEIHDFVVTDYTTDRPEANEFGGKGTDLIWVGIYGEGRWMRPEEVMELSHALMQVAHAHIKRLFVKQCAAHGIATAIGAKAAA